MLVTRYFTVLESSGDPRSGNTIHTTQLPVPKRTDSRNSRPLFVTTRIPTRVLLTTLVGPYKRKSVRN